MQGGLAKKELQQGYRTLTAARNLNTLKNIRSGEGEFVPGNVHVKVIAKISNRICSSFELAMWYLSSIVRGPASLFTFECKAVPPPYLIYDDISDT